MRHRRTSLAMLLFVGAVTPCAAQTRLSEHGLVAQTVGGTTVTVEYYRPVARGRTDLFGGVVTWGEDWTPGANWATTIDVDHELRLEGTLLPKGKYSLWAIVRPDAWTIELHRRVHLFHLARPDSTDLQLRTSVRTDSGPHTEILTFDFPQVGLGETTLRLRWGTMVVPIHFTMIAPPLRLLASAEERARYVGRYDVVISPPDGSPPRQRVVDIADVADTLRWLDVEQGPAGRREFLLSPAGPDDAFTRAVRTPDGQFWREAGLTLTFTMMNGRPEGFEVQIDDGSVLARGKRRR